MTQQVCGQGARFKVTVEGWLLHEQVCVGGGTVLPNPPRTSHLLNLPAPGILGRLAASPWTS